MLSLPITFTSVIGVFAPVSSRPVWQHVKVLLTGAILAPGKRTVTVILQIMVCSAAPDFQTYHRVLNRAVWSPLKAAGEDAIRLSMRDTILALEGDLLQAFVDRLRRLVKGVLEDPAFLQRLILEVAGRVAPIVERAELLLPVEFVTLEDLQHQPEEATPGTLMHFVLSMGGGMLPPMETPITSTCPLLLPAKKLAGGVAFASWCYLPI